MRSTITRKIKFQNKAQKNTALEIPHINPRPSLV